MKTFKLNFKNTSNNLDFVLIDSNNEGEAIELFIKNSGFENEILAANSMISIEDTTNKVVDFN
jgi:hypothetical protein